MRWKIAFGILFCLLAAVVLAVTIIVPQGTSHEVRITTAQGIDGILQVALPTRGWTGDWAPVKIDFTSLNSKNSTAPFTIRVRLEMAGTDIKPAGSVSRVITPGEAAKFSLQLRSSQKGNLAGVLWVYGQAQGSAEQLLFAREFNYDSLYFWILSPQIARIIGGIGFVWGLFILFLPRPHKQTPKI